MANIEHVLIGKKYHEALEGWQRTNFPDINLLQRNWSNYFPGEKPFSLCAKVQCEVNPVIEQGRYRGEKKFERAREMKGSMLYQAIRIIKAQCSTELGSIQQHQETVDHSYSDLAKFSVLRIMAEELRHAYQMFWVLSHDDTWSATGSTRIADNLMDELLSMSTGSHVLDAFNIKFTDALDNICFACFVDRVGKFQLSMQEEFSYKPMAASMRPMLKEEAFHLMTGWNVLKEVCELAAVGAGRWSLDDVQRKINLWFPRAIEMFGSEEGGSSNIEFSFKSTANKDATESYVREVEWLVSSLNAAIIKAQNPMASRSEVRSMIDGGQVFLTLPSRRFLRLRGGMSIEDSALDVHGRPVDIKGYEKYLASVLPVEFMSTDFFRNYINRFPVQQIVREAGDARNA